MQIIYKKISKLKPADYNPRKISRKQLGDLKASIMRFHAVEPAVINTYEGRENIIISGHQRIKVAKELGWKDFPCVEVNLTPDKEKELNIRMNKNTGDWDWDLLKGFEKNSLSDWGFGKDELDLFGSTVKEHKRGKTDDDAVPATPETATTKQGDLYILGEHRLLCGDSTKENHVEKLMKRKKAEICFTSPPYNVGHLDIKGNKETEKKYNSNEDSLSEDEYKEFLFKNIDCSLKYCSEILYNVGLVENNKRVIIDVLSKYKAIFKDIIYWKKDTAAPHIQKGIINNKVEFILCFGDGKRKFQNAQFSQGTFWNVIEGANASKNEYSDIHKATFPVYLPESIISNFANNNALIYDCFGGSGSTLIACEKTGRKCRMMEIDPIYCDVIVKRWEEFTGEKAILQK